MDNNNPIYLLLIEKDIEQAESLIESLSEGSIERLHITHVTNVDDAFREIKSSIQNIILLDIDDLNISGLQYLNQRYPNIPIIVLTTTADASVESKMMEEGAQDYLLKEHISPHYLEHAIKSTLDRNNLQLALKAEQKNMSKLLKTLKSNDTEKLKETDKNDKQSPSTETLLLKAKQQKQAEALLTDLQKRYALILESAGEGIYGLDADGQIMFINPAAERLLGWEAGKLAGKVFHQVCHHSQEDGSPYPIEKCPIHSNQSQSKVRRGSNQVYWRKDGTYFPIEYTSTPIIENGQLVGTVVNFRDITERKQTEKRMTQLAMHDTLTSLANRLQFEKALKKTVSIAEDKNQKLGLLFVDLDEFKQVNDNLGHDIGDRLLQEVAKRLYSCVRKNDFIARLGGDEFAVILGHIKDNEEAGVVAQKIIDRLSSPFKLGNYHVRVSASVGIACYPRAAKTSAELLKAADIAMYRAKELGRNNYQYFSEKVKAQNLYRSKIENELTDALTNKEFTLMYQPKFNLAKKELTGFEILLRWENPRLGITMPDDFVHIAEETGILIPIGEWTIQEASEQFGKWRKELGIDYKLSINLSPKQLLKKNLPNLLTSALKANNIPAKQLEIELTESAIMSEAEVEESLKKLHGIGITVAIDDFGTGYSSLSRLRYLPINTLKIDKSFITELSENKNDAIITQSILALGKSLNLTVIAEGIETKEQLEFLQENNCDEGQGHYFSPPLTAKEMTEYLLKNTKN